MPLRDVPVAEELAHHRAIPGLGQAIVVAVARAAAGELPAGITFLGRPFDDAKMIQLAYSYEQMSLHRRAPGTTP